MDGIVRSRTREALPWGTIVINLTGSVLLGLLAGLTANRIVPETVHLVVGAGVLGGFTTFSTPSFETVLLQERRWIAGAVTGLGVLFMATAAAGLGMWIGSLP